MTSPLVSAQPQVVNVGAERFAADLEDQGATVTRVAWRPPPADADVVLEALAAHGDRIATANDETLRRMNEVDPIIVGIGRAIDVVPGLDARTILHAGPPIGWADMCGPLRGAIIGALLHEGLASSAEEARGIAENKGVTFSPCHDHAAVGPMAGVVSASMPVWIVEDSVSGRRAYATLNEGLGKVLRFGAFDESVQSRLAWMQNVLAPTLAGALAVLESPISVRSLIAQALQMGDEGHNRNRAATSLLLRSLVGPMLSSSLPTSDVASVVQFIDANDHFTLNVTMAAGKCTADAAAGVDASSIVTAMARNGTEFGIRVSATGSQWFTAPASDVTGLYFPGFSAIDANPDIGDSTITETIGLGGFALAAAPAIVRFVGGQASDAEEATLSMYGITWGESTHYRIPALDFRGTPLGIDIREVVHSGTMPVINTGIAHREPGIGQIGAGLVTPPTDAFVSGLRGFLASI